MDKYKGPICILVGCVCGYTRLFMHIGRGPLITKAKWSLTWKLM